MPLDAVLDPAQPFVGLPLSWIVAFGPQGVAIWPHFNSLKVFLLKHFMK
jgi:hypothetical protein